MKVLRAIKQAVAVHTSITSDASAEETAVFCSVWGASANLEALSATKGKTGDLQ